MSSRRASVCANCAYRARAGAGAGPMLVCKRTDALGGNAQRQRVPWRREGLGLLLYAVGGSLTQWNPFGIPPASRWTGAVRRRAGLRGWCFVHADDVVERMTVLRLRHKVGQTGGMLSSAMW